MPLLLFITVASTGEALAGSRGTFEFRQGVVVDPERAAVYLMNLEHGIDAVDLVTGGLGWRTDRAAKPLLRHLDWLVAQTEPTSGQQFLRIALLNTRDIAADPHFVDIPLPAGVRPTIDEQMESSFGATARAHEDGVVLSWKYTYKRATGPPPGPDDRAFDREAAGSVWIDIHTGRIRAADKMTLPEPDLRGAVSRLRDAGALAGGVWRVGDAWVAIERATHRGQQRVTLKRWRAETGEALADIILFDGGLSFRSLSADKRHLLASRRDPSNNRRWEWSVFSLDTGARVAKLPHDEPGAGFVVYDSRLIHETNVTLRHVGAQVIVKPGTLRAVDLERGTEVWSQAIRDTRYRGPHPPSTAR